MRTRRSCLPASSLVLILAQCRWVTMAAPTAFKNGAVAACPETAVRKESGSDVLHLNAASVEECSDDPTGCNSAVTMGFDFRRAV